jgi:hypothetical protein
MPNDPSAFEAGDDIAGQARKELSHASFAIS